MSEEDNTTGALARGSPTVVIESASGTYKTTFKPTEIQDETTVDLHQKHTPAVSCTHTLTDTQQQSALTENWKDSTEGPIKDIKENELEMLSERRKVAKNLSQVTTIKRDSHSPVTIPMTPIETEPKTVELLKTMPTTTWKAKPSVTLSPDIGKMKEDIETKENDKDSITSEITELRTPEAVNKTPEWLEEEEAGGLPRSASRSSRVTRAVRQLFCCGVQLEAPSEDNMSSPRSGYFNSGI